MRNYRTTITIIFILIIGVLFRTYFIERIIVNGNSMSETFENGHVVIIRRFGVNQINRFDVVVVMVEGRSMLKRVVGLPTETILLNQGKIYINGTLIYDRHGTSFIYGGIAEMNEIILVYDEYFLLGDNREYSKDSRHFGAVRNNDIRGVVIFQLFPFNRIGIVRMED